MAVLCFIFILFTGILLQNGLYAHVIPSETLSDEEFEDVLHVLRNYSLLKEQHLSKEANAGCKCTAGICAMKDGKQVCQCPPEFGNYSATLCKECECGKGANCTFEPSGWFSVSKICICPNGYLTNGEKCIAVSTSTSLRTSTLPITMTTHFKDMSTPSTNYVSSIRTTKTFPSSTRECDCGKYSLDCTMSYWGKVCDCMQGYTQIAGICGVIESSTPSSTTDMLQSSTVTTRITTPECDCGKYSTDCKISFYGNRKICYCMDGYTQTDDWCKAVELSTFPSTTNNKYQSSTRITTPECDCGKYSKDCKISFYGNRKICYCLDGYTQIDDWCKAELSTVPSTTNDKYQSSTRITTPECDCGKYSTDCKISFYGNRKICYCMDGYTPIDGWCEAMETSSVPTTDNFTSTAVTRYETTLACDCGKYSKGCRISWWGTKVCDCMNGYAQNDGICAARESTTPFPTTNSYIGTSTLAPVTSTISFSTTLECDCGKYSKGCTNSWFGKVCSCLPGYIQVNGTCEKCYCGKNAKSCTLKGNWKKCICKKGYSERLGICTECNCGENSLACSFSRNGSRKCDCRNHYAQKKDTCLATCLGSGDCSNGTVCTKGDGGKSFCECPPNFRGETCEISILCEKLESTCQAMEAVCVLKDSNAYCGCPRGKKMNFKLGLCEDICNQDKCLHGKCEIFGENFKCSCDEGYSGSRCEEKIKSKTNNSLLWPIIFLSFFIFICIMQFGMLCLLCGKRK